MHTGLKRALVGSSLLPRPAAGERSPARNELLNRPHAPRVSHPLYISVEASRVESAVMCSVGRLCAPDVMQIAILETTAATLRACLRRSAQISLILSLLPQSAPCGIHICPRMEASTYNRFSRSAVKLFHTRLRDT